MNYCSPVELALPGSCIRCSLHLFEYTMYNSGRRHAWTRGYCLRVFEEVRGS